MAKGNDVFLTVVQWGLVLVIVVFFGPRLLASSLGAFQQMNGQLKAASQSNAPQSNGAAADALIDAYGSGYDAAMSAIEKAQAGEYAGPFRPDWYAKQTGAETDGSGT